jgi:hypothetical protein
MQLDNPGAGEEPDRPETGGDEDMDDVDHSGEAAMERELATRLTSPHTVFLILDCDISPLASFPPWKQTFSLRFMTVGFSISLQYCHHGILASVLSFIVVGKRASYSNNSSRSDLLRSKKPYTIVGMRSLYGR